MATKLSGTYDKAEKCGCEVRWADDALVDGINFCPLHAAAPALLEALEEPAKHKCEGTVGRTDYVDCRCWTCEARSAIAQAKEVPAHA